MSNPFSHAVASFDPTATSVLLWTRAPEIETLAWVVATDAGLHDVVARGHVAPDRDRDHTATVDVGDLAPATTYFYRFDVDGQTSPIGRTRTLPDGPTDRLRLGLVTCARYSMAPLGVYRALAEREVDLVVHLGDYIYEDDGSKGPRRHEPRHPCRTLGDYRARIGQLRRDPDAQALHLRHPMVAILDDHDVADNCWTTGAKKHVDDDDGPWDERALAAVTARQEWLPQRLRDQRDPRTTWRSIPIGDLAELVLLDTRLSGRDEQAGDGGDPPLDDPERSLLGAEQRAWLQDRLADDTRPWVLVASGVVINEVSLPLPAIPGINHFLPNGYAALDGEVLHDDQWDGYPAERSNLARHLARRGAAGGRAVLVSGDIHSSWAFEGPRLDGQPVAVEMTVPAVASKPMGRAHMPGAWRALDALVSRLEHVPWADVTRRGYGIIDVTRDSTVMEWWFVEPTDADPCADQWLGAAWRTDRSAWPPSLTETDPTDDPERAPLRDPLPPRPDDLDRLRRSHRRRLVLERSALAALTVGAVVGAARVVRR